MFWCTADVEIRVNPTRYEATVGETFTIDCVTKSPSNGPALWLKRNFTEERYNYITNSADGQVLHELRNKFNVQGQSEGRSRLKISNIQLPDEGYYLCKKSSSQDASANMTLTVSGTDYNTFMLSPQEYCIPKRKCFSSHASNKLGE